MIDSVNSAARTNGTTPVFIFQIENLQTAEGRFVLLYLIFFILLFSGFVISTQSITIVNKLLVLLNFFDPSG